MAADRVPRRSENRRSPERKKGRFIFRTLAFLGFLCLLIPSAAVAGAEQDELGRNVNVPAEPRRIVSLAPNITEILFALELEARIVGATSYCNYPERAKRIPRVGGFTDVSLETIVSLAPDLVLATADGNRKETVEQIERMGLPVYVVNPKNLEGILATMRRIGRITGSGERARTLTSRFARRVETVSKRVAGRPRPTVFFQVGLDPIVTVGRNTFIDELVGIAGGASISSGDRTRYPRYSVEEVLARKPDIIVISTMERAKDPSAVAEIWRRWREIPAVANGRIHPLDPDLIARPSPRIIDALEILARMFHPDAYGSKTKAQTQGHRQ
jgi:iron complex transport system substrate-binding protein